MNGYKLKYTCEKKFNARCVTYEGKVPEGSSLKADDVCSCITVEEVLENLLTSVSKLQNGLDLSSLGKNCLQYETVNGEIQLKSVLSKLEQAVCNNGGSSGATSNALSLDIRRLDLKCLQSICNDEIRTLQELLQAIINKICA